MLVLDQHVFLSRKMCLYVGVDSCCRVVDVMHVHVVSWWCRSFKHQQSATTAVESVGKSYRTTQCVSGLGSNTAGFLSQTCWTCSSTRSSQQQRTSHASASTSTPALVKS